MGAVEEGWPHGLGGGEECEIAETSCGPGGGTGACAAVADGVGGVNLEDVAACAHWEQASGGEVGVLVDVRVRYGGRVARRAASCTGP